MNGDRSHSAKVFCVGFQKTGTTSLYAALTALGYKTASVVGRDLSAEQLRAEAEDLVLQEAARVDAAQDMPWPLFFEALDRRFPGSKFILTVRASSDWYASVEKHFGTTPNAMQAFVYGDDAAAPAGNRDRYVEVYERHNARVTEYFSGREEDFLVMDLAQGDGWAKLCGFLGLEAPDTAFPVKNRASDRQTLSFRVRRRLLRLFGGYLAPEQA